jgi:hypothetical protein
LHRLLVSACLVVSFVFAVSIGGRVEGWLFPVVDPARIDRAEPVGESWTRIEGRVRLLRTCRFVDLEWRVGTIRSFRVADKVYERSGMMRSGDIYHFGPWLMGLTPDQLRNRSRAVILHHCHPLWLTRSVFYDSSLP